MSICFNSSPAEDLKCPINVQFGEPQRSNLAVDSVNFATNLYKEAQKTAKNQNLILSPVSIQLALGMVHGGSGSTTKEQFLNVVLTKSQYTMNTFLTYPNVWLSEKLNNYSGGKQYELKSANAVFVEKSLTLKMDFRRLLTACYKSDAEPLDFINQSSEATEEINAWVSNNTAQKIQNLIPPGSIDQATRLVLSNAIYFKAEWETPFLLDYGGQTYNGSFYSTSNYDYRGSDAIPVKLMNRLGDFLLNDQNEDVKVLGIPYKGKEVTMFVFLPERGKSIQELEGSITGERLNDLMNGVAESYVDVTIPKFKIDARVGLKEALQSLGLTEMFADSADFSGITDDTRLKVDNAFHKGFIEVNELGTEAAAATGVVARPLSLTKSFVANHPFLFAIRHEATGTLLFMGSVKDGSAI